MTRVVLLALAAAGLAAPALAAPDWSKAPKKTITVFYPGVASMEWTLVGTEHGGARGMRRGETCASCHDEEPPTWAGRSSAGRSWSLTRLR